MFERIADATRALDTRPRRELLAVTSLPSFAARWLVPRLGAFAAAHPQIDLRLVATERPVDLARESVDVGIRFGYGRYPGLRVEKLADDEFFPVCCAAPARRGRALDLRRLPLLHDDSPDGWRRWLRATGRSDVDPERGHVFTDASMMLQAAIDGHGVAMARRALVRGRTGRRPPGAPASRQHPLRTRLLPGHRRDHGRARPGAGVPPVAASGDGPGGHLRRRPQ